MTGGRDCRWAKSLAGKASRGLGGLLLGLGVICVGAVAACVAPRSFKQVKEPRSGEALHDRVAVVYSKHYQINLGGLERMHSFDIRKYAKIYRNRSAVCNAEQDRKC